mgnify:CR=1 FL=1
MTLPTGEAFEWLGRAAPSEYTASTAEAFEFTVAKEACFLE